MSISSKKTASSPRRVRGSPAAQSSIKLPSGSRGHRALGCSADLLLTLGSQARPLSAADILVDVVLLAALPEPGEARVELGDGVLRPGAGPSGAGPLGNSLCEVVGAVAVECRQERLRPWQQPIPAHQPLARIGVAVAAAVVV